MEGNLLRTEYPKGEKAERLMAFAMSLLLVYPAFTEVLQRFLGTGIIRFTPIVVGAAVTEILLIEKDARQRRLLLINRSSEAALWMAFLFLAVYRNYDLRYLQNLGGIGIFIVTVLMVPVLSCRTEWVEEFARMLTVFMAVHVIVTLLSYAFPAIYDDGIASVLQHENIGGDPGYMYGLWKNHGYNAMCISIAALMFSAKIMANYQKRGVDITLAVLALFALLLTNKRGPLLFCAVANLTTWMILIRDSKKKCKKILLLIVGLVIMYAILAWKFPSALRVFNRFSDNSSKDISTGRFDLYRQAFSLFLEHPIVGVGWGGFRFYYNTTVAGYSTFATFDVHNIYLQVLCETGLIGAAVFLTIAYFSLRNAIYIMCHWEEQMGCSFAAAIAVVNIQFFTLMYGLTGNSLYVPTVFVPYIFACAATYAIRARQKQVVGDCARSIS